MFLYLFTVIILIYLPYIRHIPNHMVAKVISGKNIGKYLIYALKKSLSLDYFQLYYYLKIKIIN